MAKTNSTHLRSIRPAVSARRAARSRRPTKAEDSPPTPMEQLMAAAKCVGMRGIDSEADANPLLRGNTPQEAIKECQDLAKWLYHQAFFSKDDDHGARAVYLMLHRALCAIDRQLDGFFEGARRVVGTQP